MREFFDHTADLGFRIHALDWPSLLHESALCLYEAIVEDLNTVIPLLEYQFEVIGDDREYLLFDLLRGLLLRTETEGTLFSTFRIESTDSGINCVARGEPLDRQRHQLSHEVKAITYHGLKVEEHPEGWTAEVIVDI